MTRFSPSDRYLRLALLDTELLNLWYRADNFNRHFGPRDQCAVWYGYGRYPYGFKEMMSTRVGWLAPKDVHPDLRTSEAYDVALNELTDLLARPKRLTAGMSPWRIPLFLIRDSWTEEDVLEIERKHIQDELDLRAEKGARQ
jgi:hypothetical protein